MKNQIVALVTSLGIVVFSCMAQQVQHPRYDIKMTVTSSKPPANCTLASGETKTGSDCPGMQGTATLELKHSKNQYVKLLCRQTLLVNETYTARFDAERANIIHIAVKRNGNDTEISCSYSLQ